jgi:2C-methyl-D-erythritol 2,4-cyclodiphosphate synthase
MIYKILISNNIKNKIYKNIIKQSITHRKPKTLVLKKQICHTLTIEQNVKNVSVKIKSPTNLSICGTLNRKYYVNLLTMLYIEGKNNIFYI